MRSSRVLVLMVLGVSGAVTVAVARFPGLAFASNLPPLRGAFNTVPPVIALAAGFLVFGRFLRCGRLNELILASSLGMLALSELAFVTVPVLLQRYWPDLSVWAALASSALGTLLFALAAFVPRRRLRRPGLAAAASGAAMIAALPVVAVLAAAFAGHLPPVPVTETARGILARPDLHTHAVLPVVEIAMAATYALAAVGFLRLSKRFDDGFFGVLAISAVLASAAHCNYFLYPTLYSRFVSLGDVFLLCFYALLLSGSAREIGLRWHTVPEAAVLEERRRIARDLHDGPAQELAYLVRNLDSLNGMVDQDTWAHLRRAAERAELDIRLAINTFAASRSLAVNVAIAQAAAEVAARDHVELDIDMTIPVVRLSSPRADALLRIAREAVSNAACHSGAARVTLSLHRQGSRVQLRVSDDGSGFDPDVPADGFGLISMRDRASSVGGDLRISSVPGSGTEVEATL
jgi:signal transduction histidine kinase